MSTFSDYDLPPDAIARARSGDVAAWEAIYRAFERPVFTLARRLVPQRAAAEDLAQDVFVEVLTRLGQYEGRGSFAGWVRAIAVNRCLSHLRSPWQRGLRWLDRTAGVDVDAALERPDETARDGGDALDLARAMARLPDTARAVVWLHDVEGYTHAEIGALFDGTPSFSKSQLARAHERLREWLHESGVEAPCLPMSTNC
jgi:RNA polymerase sigma-70 factor (ECF subfamily)